jgi:hypothetical protein
MVKMFKFRVTMHIQTKNLIIIFALCSINHIFFAAFPWQRLESDYQELLYEQEVVLDRKSGFVGYGLFAFADETPESVRDKMKGFNVRDLSTEWSSLGGDEPFVLCALAQSGNYEKLEGLLRHTKFTPVQLQTALQFAQRQKKFDFYESLNSFGQHEECEMLLSEKFNNKNS